MMQTTHMFNVLNTICFLGLRCIAAFYIYVYGTNVDLKVDDVKATSVAASKPVKAFGQKHGESF